MTTDVGEIEVLAIEQAVLAVADRISALILVPVGVSARRYDDTPYVTVRVERSTNAVVEALTGERSSDLVKIDTMIFARARLRDFKRSRKP